LAVPPKKRAFVNKEYPSLTRYDDECSFDCVTKYRKNIIVVNIVERDMLPFVVIMSLESSLLVSYYAIYR